MPRKYTITYHDSPTPIREPVTKFGNLGTDGTGYAFISEDGRVGKFFWSR
jgi:hypothetical protein